MFGLLRDVHLRSSVEQLSAEFESLYVISHRFREVSRWHSRRADGDRGMVHQWTERLVEQEIRIGILRLSRIGENKIYRPFRYRVIDDRKKAPWQFCVGDRSLFVETASFRTQREQSSGNCRLPLVIQNQYSACQAAECSRSLHSQQSCVQGTGRASTRTVCDVYQASGLP